jgi:hypothetical protein
MTNPRLGQKVQQRDSLQAELQQTRESKARLENLREVLPERAKERIDQNIDKKEDKIVVIEEGLKAYDNLSNIPPRGPR